MSSILKALKKLEEEKSLPNNEKDVKISRDILKPRTERRSSVKWLWLLFISGTTVIIVLSLALLRKSTTVDEARPPLLPSISQLSSSRAPLAPTVSPQPPEIDGKKTVITPPSTLKVPDLPALTPARKEPGILTELPPNRAVTIELPKTELPPKSAPPLRTPLPDEATLTLSGIAWNKDSADRLAIINGQPAATGAVVNGAVVEEILQDKVRMNLSGRTFELFLGKQTKTN